MKSLPNKSIRSQKGFTLVELLIVIGILGILAVGALILLNPIARFNQTKDANAKAQLSQAVSAINSYYATNGSYPDTINVIVPSELASVPKGYDGTPADYADNAAHTQARIYIPLSTSTGSANTDYWCWTSTTGATYWVDTAAACTAP